MDTSAPSCRAAAPAGVFVGMVDRGVRSWRGIRFALPAIGERRFRDPVAAPDADGETDATVFGSVCPQPANPAIPLGDGAVQDEDCLSLNVWAPESEAAAPRPVMVWPAKWKLSNRPSSTRLSAIATSALARSGR